MVTAVNQLLNSCCGDNEMVSTLMSKLPWNKNSNSEEEEVAEEVKQQRNDIKLPAKKGAFSNKEKKFESVLWKNLPIKARKAAESLGYDEQKWNESEWLEIEGKHWHDLSKDELKAVETLGWEEEAWEHQYEHKKWADLPDCVQKAAETSGFTEESWDHHHKHWPDNLHAHWQDLEEKDREAMSVLGFHKVVWG